jgi:hypothetical protein
MRLQKEVIIRDRERKVLIVEKAIKFEIDNDNDKKYLKLLEERLDDLNITRR